MPHSSTPLAWNIWLDSTEASARWRRATQPLASPWRTRHHCSTHLCRPSTSVASVGIQARIARRPVRLLAHSQRTLPAKAGKGIALGVRIAEAAGRRRRWTDGLVAVGSVLLRVLLSSEVTACARAAVVPWLRAGVLPARTLPLSSSRPVTGAHVAPIADAASQPLDASMPAGRRAGDRQLVVGEGIDRDRRTRRASPAARSSSLASAHAMLEPEWVAAAALPRRPAHPPVRDSARRPSLCSP